MLEYIQPRIVWSYKAMLKYGEVIKLLEIAKPDSLYNMNLIGGRWVEGLAIAKTARSQTIYIVRKRCIIL